MAVDDLSKRNFAEFPGGVQGGVIENVKRAVMVALKEGLTGSTLGFDSPVQVNLEYPMEPENYPGIWVQFSFTEFTNAGIGHEILRNDGTDEDPKWSTIRAFLFKGACTLTMMALTNLERDRLADSVVTMLMFSRPPQSVITKPSEDTKQFRSLITALRANPYVGIAINHDTLTPGGQTVTPGVPWDEELLGYEDNYSFQLIGETNIVFRNDGTYSLEAIEIEPELVDEPFDRFDWH